MKETTSSMGIKPTQYRLTSAATNAVFDDKGWTIDAPDSQVPSLIRALYDNKQLHVADDDRLGIFRFSEWLPVKNALHEASAPITYKSEKLAARLGLNNLYITFNGYWPERGARMTTCSFKEMEAFSVCSRLDESLREQVLVVASAGNTARAFAKVCSDNGIKLLLCVPEDNISALWFDKPLNDCVKLICSKKGSDYFDSINLSNCVCEFDGYLAEGGAKNIARRDGMGTTVLSATTFIGRIPDYYFQAVGSGTGAIAAWEANMRFIEDGRFGHHKMRLCVSQNKPFTPMYDAWKNNSRTLLEYDSNQARKDASEIMACVLSNRKPPYSISGGLYDALIDTKGDMYAIDNQEALSASQLFEETEGIDIHPAAAVSLGALIQAVNNNEIDKDAIIMLNITGGGEKRFKAEHDLWYLKPDRVFDIDFKKEDVAAELESLKW